MKNKNQNYIYIEIDEEIPSIIDKIKKNKGKEATLVISDNSLILGNVLNLKILKKEAENLDKTISIMMNDEDKMINEKNKQEEVLEVSNNDDLVKSDNVNNFLEEKKNGTSVNVHLVDDDKSKVNFPKIKSENKIKMFDIVKKIDKDIDKSINFTSDFNVHRTETKEENNNNKFLEARRGVESQIDQKIENFAKKRKKNVKILSSFSSKIIVLFLLISFITILAVIMIVLPRADVNIVLEKEIVEYNFEFTAEDSLSEIDVVNNKIPLEEIEVIGEESGEYVTTGKKHMQEKASGEITVFNEYSSSPQRIVATTRFLSKESGKLFRIEKAVTIPGFSRVEGVDIPGQVTVIIYADKFGEDYNIKADSFHLPGLQGSPKYSSVYARSLKSMSGGIDEEVPYFSQSDYLTAKESLVKLAQDKNDEEFLSKESEEDLMLEDTKTEEDLEIETNVKVGDIAENFQMKVKAITTISSVSKSDLDRIVSEKINSKLDTNKRLLDDNSSYEIGEILIIEEEKVIIPIVVSRGLVLDLDIDDLKNNIAGKNELELNNYFNNMSGIKSAGIALSPFWVSSVPSAYDKINITIDINNSL